MKNWMIFGLLSFALLTGVILAEEATTTVPVVVDVPAPSWKSYIPLQDIIQALSALFILMLNAFGAWLGYRFRNNNILKDALEAVRIGVDHIEHEYVEELKTAAEDGKISKEEIAEANRLALETAKKYATGPALKLIESWGAEQAKSYITRIVESKKDTSPLLASILQKVSEAIPEAKKE